MGLINQAPTDYKMSIQNLIMNLQKFWADQGCYLAQSYDLEVGAGTMTPDTFFRVLDKKPWKVAYVQPSRRPTDGRYGENPHRVQKHFQYQVIMKPSPFDIQQRFIDSLTDLGIQLQEHKVCQHLLQNPQGYLKSCCVLLRH